MTGTCAACGELAEVEAHHVTGRAGRGLSYLDLGFTVEMCKTCHDLEHVSARRAGLAWPSGPFLSHRLARTANLLSRLVDNGRLPKWLAPVAGLMSEAAEAFTAELEERAAS